MKNQFKNFLVILGVFLIIMFIFGNYRLNTQKAENIDMKTFLEEIDKDSIESVNIVGNTKLEITLKNKDKQILLKEPNETLSTLLKNYDVSPEKTKNLIGVVKEDNSFGFWLATLAPILLPLIFFMVLIYFLFRGVQGANSKAMMFGQSRAREIKINTKGRITFKDVAGVKEAKEELLEVVDFLKNPKKFTELGAKIPKGVLLMGAPGTGKTLLAKAVAGEAKVPFFTISGSEFVEMFVGVGASRVRDLFTKAKKSAPCIVFIDEIDAVGRQRGAGLGGSHDEREQTLNQILVEMDGFEPNTNVIVMAATNRPDVLDPALLRPGRFDRRVVLDMPDINDREQILSVHAQNKPLAKDVDLRKVASRTPGFAGADLANLLNEAAILTARLNEKTISMKTVLSSIEKVMLGPERKSHVLSDEEKKITAYHEAGHALVGHFLPHCDPVQKVSIISRGQAAGYTLNMPDKDTYLTSRSKFLDEIAMMLGGRVAEKEKFADVTTGASNDLMRATKLARKLITQYGMAASLPPRTFGHREEMIFLGKEIHEQRDYSEKVAEKIDEEIALILNEAFAKATKVINEHQDKLEDLVNKLLIQETIDREAFVALMDDTAQDKKDETKVSA